MAPIFDPLRCQLLNFFSSTTIFGRYLWASYPKALQRPSVPHPIKVVTDVQRRRE